MKQSQEKKISSDKGEESALWMNKLNNEGAREALTSKELKGVMKLPAGGPVYTANPFYCTFWVIQGVCQANFALQAEFRA